jgi:polysaccharide biosynthesis transport protein
LNALGSIYDIVLIHAGEASTRATALIGKCQAALLLAPGLRQGEVAKIAKSLLESGLKDVQFARLESVKSEESRLAASA